jgi:hypothetical protein
MNSNIGGAFIWDTSLDDFKGEFCCQGKYPLINTVANVFTGNLTYSTNQCCNGGSSSAATTTPAAAITTTNGGVTNLVVTTTQSNIVYGTCSSSTTIMPHPTDCNRFIRCELNSNSNTYTEYIETCPASLMFSPSLKVCDWPQNVVCQTYTSATTAAPSTTATTTRPTTVTTTVTTTTRPKIDGCDGIKQYASHSTDCTKMIACSNGAELVCAANLAFDYAAQECKSATLLNCKQTTVAAVTTTTTSSVVTSLFGGCGPNVNIVPHPTDCNKFIRCEQIGNTTSYTERVETCPGGLNFNPDLKVCDWAQNVVCRTYSYATTLPPATTTRPKIDGCDGIKQYAMHPTDCTRMIACNNGAELVCAANLAFDYAAQECKLATILNCKTTQAPVVTTTTTTTTTTTAATSSTTLIDYSKCPSGQRFSPHSTDCAKFLQCERSPTGTLVETEVLCPGGLLFNNNIKVCDWPHNVVCVLASTTRATTTTTTTTVSNLNNEYICLKDGLFPSPVTCTVYYGRFFFVFIFLLFFRFFSRMFGRSHYKKKLSVTWNIGNSF